MIAKRNHRLFPLAPFGEQGQCRIVSQPGVGTFNRMSAGGVLLVFGPALDVAPLAVFICESPAGESLRIKRPHLRVAPCALNQSGDGRSLARPFSFPAASPAHPCLNFFEAHDDEC
jgi:hypothetical protein